MSVFIEIIKTQMENKGISEEQLCEGLCSQSTVHEMGHALGYAGHYDAGNVMTTYYNDMSSIYPSTAEENHLGQAYW